MSGPFLVRQAFEELCRRCDGAVIFVSLLGTSGVLDLDELDESNLNDVDYVVNDYAADTGDDGEDDEGEHINLEMLRKQKSAVQKMFRRNGAWVDLSSDPFGWEEDTENDCGNSFVQRSSMDKLQSIAMAIRRAAANIESRRPSSRGKEKNQRKQQMQPPIPIVFETLTPLLHLHGVEKINLLIKSLGRSMPSSTTVPSGINPPILSPIIVPILYESLRPSEHRCLEDIADSMIHLNVMDTQRRVSASSLNDPNSTTVISGVMDLVRRGGGGGGNLGGKLIRHCVPFHIMRAASIGTFPLDARDSCYWVLDRDANDDTEESNKDQQVSNQSTGSTTTTSAGEPASSTTGPSRPRIYLQDDDPEFDDFDEEDDLDDDIDL